MSRTRVEPLPGLTERSRPRINTTGRPIASFRREAAWLSVCPSPEAQRSALEGFALGQVVVAVDGVEVAPDGVYPGVVLEAKAVDHGGGRSDQGEGLGLHDYPDMVIGPGPVVEQDPLPIEAGKILIMGHVRQAYVNPAAVGGLGIDGDLNQMGRDIVYDFMQTHNLKKMTVCLD